MKEEEIIYRLERIERLLALSTKDVLSRKDLAEYLGKSERTVRRIEDEITHYRNEHGTWFKKKDVEEWQCRVKCEAMVI